MPAASGNREPIPARRRWASGATWWPRGTAGNRFVWVDGVPFLELAQRKAAGAQRFAADDRLRRSQGGGIRGAIEYAKIYRRVLSPERDPRTRRMARRKRPAAEPRRRVLISPARPISKAGPLARARRPPSRRRRLVVGTKSPQSLIINSRLDANIDKKDFVTLRMSVDKGGQAKLIFVTTKGAGQIPFPIVADRKPHSYVIEPWTQIGWGGNLLALGLVPSELERQHRPHRVPAKSARSPGPLRKSRSTAFSPRPPCRGPSGPSGSSRGCSTRPGRREISRRRFPRRRAWC